MIRMVYSYATPVVMEPRTAVKGVLETQEVHCCPFHPAMARMGIKGATA